MSDAIVSRLETYLTAAQTALESGEYATAKLKIDLAEIELAKLPLLADDDGRRAQFRETFASLRAMVAEYVKTSARGTRRSIARGV